MTVNNYKVQYSVQELPILDA